MSKPNFKIFCVAMSTYQLIQSSCAPPWKHRKSSCSAISDQKISKLQLPASCKSQFNITQINSRIKHDIHDLSSFLSVPFFSKLPDASFLQVPIQIKKLRRDRANATGCTTARGKTTTRHHPNGKHTHTHATIVHNTKNQCIVLAYCTHYCRYKYIVNCQ